MYFDRFDICAAYYWYAIGYSGDYASCEYANLIHRRLDAIPYKPSMSEEYGKLSENAQEIYDALVARREPASVA
jgi:hypothetical protein